MQKVDMRREHRPPNSYGDCLAACVATILKIPYEDVPDFHDGERWEQKLETFTLALGLVPVHLDANVIPGPPVGYALAGGPSPRGDYLHEIVVYDGSVFHDPHVSRDGLVGPVTDYTVFIPLVFAEADRAPTE